MGDDVTGRMAAMGDDVTGRVDATGELCVELQLIWNCYKV